MGLDAQVSVQAEGFVHQSWRRREGSGRTVRERWHTLLKFYSERVAAVESDPSLVIVILANL